VRNWDVGVPLFGHDGTPFFCRLDRIEEIEPFAGRSMMQPLRFPTNSLKSDISEQCKQPSSAFDGACDDGRMIRLFFLLSLAEIAFPIGFIVVIFGRLIAQRP
jgi:hypothetical protein